MDMETEMYWKYCGQITQYLNHPKLMKQIKLYLVF